MLLFLHEILASSTEFLLSVLKNALAQLSNAVIDVLQSKYITRTTRQGFYFSTSIFEACQELLNVRTLIDGIKVTERIHFIVKSNCKLLERMNISVNLFGLKL